MNQDLHLKNVWYARNQSLCYVFSGLFLLTSLAIVAYLMVYGTYELSGLFFPEDVAGTAGLLSILVISFGIVTSAMLSIVFFMLALTFRPAIHEIDHDAMLRDIANITEELLDRRLQGFYQDVTPLIRVTRMINTAQHKMPWLSHRAAEIAAQASELLATKLAPVATEAARTAHAVESAENYLNELHSNIEELQKRAADLDSRSQAAHDDGKAVADELSQLQTTLEAIRARVAVQQGSNITPLSR